MLDEFMESLFAENEDEHNNAVLSVPSNGTLHDGETFVFLTCKAIYRTAKSEIDDQAAAEDQTRQLVQSYFTAGGVLWVFRACATTKKWYGQSVQTSQSAVVSSPALGMEYVAQDVARFMHERSKVDADRTEVAAASSMAIFVDPFGTEFGVFGKDTNTTEAQSVTRSFLFGTPYIRAIRSRIASVRPSGAQPVARQPWFSSERRQDRQTRPNLFERMNGRTTSDVQRLLVPQK